MNTDKWKSVAIRKDIVEMAREIGEMTERPTSNVFAFAIKKLKADINNEQISDVVYKTKTDNNEKV